MNDNHWTLTGDWQDTEESITSGNTSDIFYRYNAKDVYLVLGGSGTVNVLVDGMKAKNLGILGESPDAQGNIVIQ